MTRDEFEKRFGCIEEYVLTFDPYMGPQVTDLETRANYIIKEKDFEEILALFRTIKGPWD
jgi:hypothetical protein